MAVMTIHDIDDATKARLRMRAARHGRSMEDEARDILRSALSTEGPRPQSLGRAIHERFATLGGVDLPEIPREPSRPPCCLRGMIFLDNNAISELMRLRPEPRVPE